MLMFPILVFVTVTLVLGALIVWLLPTRAEARLQAFTPGGQTNWTERAVKLVGPFAQLSSPTSEEDISPLRARFLQAGIRMREAHLLYFGLKTLLPLALAALIYVALSASSKTEGVTLLFCVALAALIGCYLPNVVLNMLIRERRREIFENFPDAADLMLVCVEAGLGLDAGLVKVSEEIDVKSRALAQELHWTNLEMRAGSTREKALRNLARRTGVDEIGTFAAMLVQADRFGTSVGDSLRVFSEDLRHKRMTRAEEQAAKIPTKMLIPLVLFIFPSILMVVLGPAIIQIVRTMVPMLTGVR